MTGAGSPIISGGMGLPDSISGASKTVNIPSPQQEVMIAMATYYLFYPFCSQPSTAL
jgi:hypothetical protein